MNEVSEGENILGRTNSQSKGPEAGACAICLKTIEEASVAEAGESEEGKGGSKRVDRETRGV